MDIRDVEFLKEIKELLDEYKVVEAKHHLVKKIEKIESDTADYAKSRSN